MSDLYSKTFLNTVFALQELTTAGTLQVAVDIFHADADLLYNAVPDAPFALQAIKQDPVIILLLEVLPHILNLLHVTRVADVEDLRAVVHQVRPSVRVEQGNMFFS